MGRGAHLIDFKEWLADRAKRDRRLYKKYGTPFEQGHKGEYVAIDSQGQTILGDSDVEVLRKAIEAFGRGNFAFRRVGYRVFGQWLNLNK